MVKKGGSWCSVPKCKSNSAQNDYSFFGFPRDPERSKLWTIRIGRRDLLQKDVQYLNRNCKVCSMHFEDRAFLNFLRNRLKQDAVPSLMCTPLQEEQKESEKENESPIPEPCIGAPMGDEGTKHMQETERQEECSACVDHVAESTSISLQPRLSWKSNASTQTELCLSSNTPRKTKLRRKVKTLQKKLERVLKSTAQQTDLDSVKVFKNLCDQLLPEQLSQFVKAQAICNHENPKDLAILGMGV